MSDMPHTCLHKQLGRTPVRCTVHFTPSSVHLGPALLPQSCVACHWACLPQPAVLRRCQDRSVTGPSEGSRMRARQPARLAHQMSGAGLHIVTAGLAGSALGMAPLGSNHTRALDPCWHVHAWTLVSLCAGATCMHLKQSDTPCGLSCSVSSRHAAATSPTTHLKIVTGMMRAQSPRRPLQPATCVTQR